MDTIGPCVRREKVAEFQFAPDSLALSDQAEVSRVAKQIEGELRYVFAVGHADDAAFSWANVQLGLKRARVVADALSEELANVSVGRTEDGGIKPEYIRAVSGVDWAPATGLCPSAEQGKVGVYLLWRGISPLCNAAPGVAMNPHGPSSTAGSAQPN